MAIFGSFGRQGGAGRFFPRLYYQNRSGSGSTSAAALQEAEGLRATSGGSEEYSEILELLKKLGIDISSLALQGNEGEESPEAGESTLDPTLGPPPVTSTSSTPGASGDPSWGNIVAGRPPGYVAPEIPAIEFRSAYIPRATTTRRASEGTTTTTPGAPPTTTSGTRSTSGSTRSRSSSRSGSSSALKPFQPFKRIKSFLKNRSGR